MYAVQLGTLATKLKYADAPNVEKSANKSAEPEVEMEKEWLKIGHSGAAPSVRASDRAAQRGRDGIAKRTACEKMKGEATGFESKLAHQRIA